MTPISLARQMRNFCDYTSEPTNHAEVIIVSMWGVPNQGEEVSRSYKG